MKLSNLFNSTKTISKLERLYGKKESVKKAREYSRYKRRIFLLCILASCMFSALIALVDGKREIPGKLERNGPGLGDKSVSLIAHFKQLDKEEKMQIVVKEQEYSKEELEEFERKIQEELWEVILGNNPSLEEVYTDLNLVNAIDGYPFSIAWKSEKPLLISSKGIVNKKKVREELLDQDEEEIIVRLCASLTYGKFQEDLYGYVTVVGYDRKTYDDFLDAFDEEVKRFDEASKDKDMISLPEMIDGVEISYEYNNGAKVVIVIIIGLVCGVGLVIAKDKELDKKIKERDEELNRDYPKILSQYNLYACAGMSHRNIWSTICKRYEDEVEQGRKRSFAYEEMKKCQQKIQDGMGEIEAYEEFSRNCGNVKYRAFINIIEQAVKKGKEDLNVVLDEEVEKARREENARVRMSAQELSTKLLFPMMLMLVIVIVIVIVPAFISFNN